MRAEAQAQSLAVDVRRTRLMILLGVATRLIHIGPEIKLGVFVSMIGAPFFLGLKEWLAPVAAH